MTYEPGRQTAPFQVPRDGKKDLGFNGWLLASVDSRTIKAASFIEAVDKVVRWTEIKLYKTVGGHYVAHKIGWSTLRREVPRHSATIADTVEELIKELGTKQLARDLYEKAGLDIVERID